MPAGYLSGDCHLEEIQTTIDNGIDFARSQLGSGESLFHCLDCDIPIPEKRRQVIKGCKYCVFCKDSHDRKISSQFNRKAGHDSQLR